MDGPFRALCETDFDAKDLGLSADGVVSGLEKAVQRGSLLRSQHEAESPPHLADTFYFLNSPRGPRCSGSVCKRQLARICTNQSPRRWSDRMCSSYMKKTLVRLRR